MPRVFAPQCPSRWDQSIDNWVPTMNLTPAEKHGNVVVMLPPNANRLNIEPLITIMSERMESYSEQDFILAIGDPSLIAAAAVIAHQRAGVLRMLKWDRVLSEYILVEFTV